MSCPICEAPLAEVSSAANDCKAVKCPQCGSFRISYHAEVNAKRIFERWKVSGWIREFLQQGTLDAEKLQAAEDSRVPTLMHRAERVLRVLYKRFPAGYEFSSLDANELVAVGWNRNSGEARYLLEAVLCGELNYVEHRSSGSFRITPRGLLFLEGVAATETHVGFCAMWFSPDVFPLWTDVIEPAIRSAGYDPLRMDKAEFNDRIDDEIMASIRSAKFVVSDFSGHRGGIYYEAGFAHGLGLPVIFMCRESDMKELHFDIRQYNCIEWSPGKLEEARERLMNRILATLGQGPLRPQ